MIDNKKIYDEKWNTSAVKYLQKSFINRYISFLIKQILRNHDNLIYIYKIADLGCGVGLRTKLLANVFPNAKTYGFDFSKQGIKVAQNLYTEKNLTFHVGDITKEDFGKFDLISVFEVLEHIDDWQSVVTRLVERTNKYLLFSFPVGRMRKYEMLGGHVRNFKRKEMENFLKPLGVKPIRIYYAGFPFFSPLYRDACSWFPQAVLTNNMNNIMSKKLEWLHPIMYFFACYLSTRKYLGEQFVGLFEKMES